MQQLLAKISLQTIARNADAVLKAARVPLIAVVKDDAYGHGAEAVALALHGRASAFAVCTVEEGAALKNTGIEEDVLVLTPPLGAEDALRTVSYGLIGSVTSLSVLRLLERAGERCGKVPRAHIAVNTGMNRFGVRPERARYTALAAQRAGIGVEGVYSHLFEPSDDCARQKQSALFARAAEQVKSVFPNVTRHLGATGGMLEGECYDAVRVGLALYGYLPAGAEGVCVHPAMKLYATVAQSGMFLGEGAGYARAEREYALLHTLRLGYGDGFFREGLEGVIGKLCMDAGVCEGAARWGSRKRVLKDMEAYARAHNTSVYEVLVNVTKKAVKEYV